ncbi:hypothetical protein QJS10_CPA16g01564 [Acorus calamus]|uniref:Acyl-CoA dehydrogenase family member 11 n=1 Tax=Acorus calamus TaxID=4465 RepID=A0AAV9D0G6_ACOCL|nr:hypothetical protein QJS10_CPA16g01564 [Acorus calamus]
MSILTSDLLRPVNPSHRFDESVLLRYAAANVDGFPASPTGFSVSQFGHGQSNPTFLLEVESGPSLKKRYVLRKKPSGEILQSAHAVEREFQVLKALGDHTDVPVPKVFCLCTDASVIGTAFYIMEYLEGRIFLDLKLPDLSPNRRKAIYKETAKTLAAIHIVDVNSVGLEKFGHRENYCKRQIERWARQYLASTGESKPERYPKMLELIEWLRQHIPLDDSSEALGPCLVHGDFRIDNLLFHPNEDRVIGVLDWELSTLGNQMCDVAYSSLQYIVDIRLGDEKSYRGLEFTGIPEGFPSQAEYLAEYCSASGNASAGDLAKHAGKAGNALVDSAWEFIGRKTVLPNHPSPGQGALRNHQNESGIERINQYITQGSGKFVPSQKLDSAARARELLFDGMNHASLGKDSDLLGAGLSNLEYAYLCEIMGRSVWAPQVFNCGAPDTGNMEVLLRYGTKEQQKEWLVPLLEGHIRSGFAMTEPQVASSDATNIECSIAREGDNYIINGEKWWTSGAMDPRCRILIVMGKTDFTSAKHKQQSMILVDVTTPGVKIKAPLSVFGYDDAPHGHAEVSFENVCVPASNILLGEGRGFEIAQGRLGPGRLHHCMRLIGAAERGMQLMVERAHKRRVFGKSIAEQGSFLSDLAKCRIELEMTRLLVLEAADQMDRLGNKRAQGTVAMAKVAAPNMALKVLDRAIQVHGAAGVSSKTALAHLWATARTLRIADGPDEVHLGTIAKLELRQARFGGGNKFAHDKNTNMKIKGYIEEADYLQVNKLSESPLHILFLTHHPHMPSSPISP